MAAVSDLIHFVGLAALAACAASAVLETEDKGMDLMGAVIVGLATSLGGGSLRDLLLGRPVFWLGDPVYLLVGLAAVAATFLIARRVRLPIGAFVLPDAVGLALFTVVGCGIAIQADVHWLSASLLGVINGVVGGMLRDVLVNEVPLVMRAGTLYATAAWLGALAMLGLSALGLGETVAATVGGLVILALRLAAIRYKLFLPTFRSRQ